MTENTTENPYISELRSLLKDKFFVALLGVSIVIIGVSSVYSFIKPTKGEIATSASTSQASPTPSVVLTEYEGLAGLDSTEEEPQNTLVVSKDETLFGTLKDAATGIIGKLAVSETPKVDVTPPPAEIVPQTPKAGAVYTVKEGETLWSIAEATYGSGYNFVDIAMANNLTDANIISTGQTLTLPKVESKTSTVGEIVSGATVATPKFDTYTVKEGESLWSIAEMAYGDPYMWSQIAKINMLEMPNIINPGQVLKMR